ncbi:uncharacterized protein CMC5_066080 [Chondromyces crocatus]|uniref:Uncharacterized protein n=1 Tax=Chondromyces crocatus TaxID=52 RepID=A0A0K1ENZ9_CHOCO|nr:uncharacterized protein CMC5_066080 [Chondromyces crocatus]
MPFLRVQGNPWRHRGIEGEDMSTGNGWRVTDIPIRWSLHPERGERMTRRFEGWRLVLSAHHGRGKREQGRGAAMNVCGLSS